MKISITLAVLTGTFETDLARADKATQKRMKSIKAEMEKTAKAVGAAFGAMALAAAAGIKAAIDRADELSKTAQKIGVTTESLSTLAYAAKLADVEITALQGGLNRLTRAQQDAQQGNEKLVSLFKALNVEFQNADGTLRNADETFRDIAKALDQIPDGATKSAVAIELMGRSGANLIPLTKNLEETEQRARSLGLELSTDAGKAAEEFNDRLEEVKLMAVSLATAVAVELLPDLERLVAQFQEGAEKGDGFNNSAKGIAQGIRGIGVVANFVVNYVQALGLSLAALFDGAAAAAANIGAIFSETAAAEAKLLSDRAASRFASAKESFAASVTEGPTPLPKQGTGIRGGAARLAESQAASAEAAERRLAEQYKASQDAAAAAAAAKAANAAATREAAAAAREAEKDAKREAEAMEKLAEQRYEQQRELRELRAEEERAMQEAKKLVDDTLADIAFETKLIGMNNMERQKAIALRYANVDAASKEGKAISDALENMAAAERVAEGLDVVRGATEGLFNDLMSGAKSAKEAFMDFVDGILEGIAQIVARNLTESLLGSFGSTAGGASGGGLASIFGAFFGGPKAAGGSVYPNKAYLVGEEGPEMFIPPVAGSIATASQTKKMGGSASVTQNITVVGTVDRRAADRLRIDAANNQRKAVSRSY